jgi:hypothetical protein
MASSVQEFVSRVPVLGGLRWLISVVVQNKTLYAPLSQVDPEVQNIIDKETWRQFSGLELIASEVCTTRNAPSPLN